MKYQHNILLVVFLLFVTLTLPSHSFKTSAPQGISFTIKNDTKGNVRLYDGKGYFTINRGSAKKVNVDAGRKYYKGDNGKKGDFLFEVKSGFDGKTIKLSDYL